jgi:hypothetical protein
MEGRLMAETRTPNYPRWKEALWPFAGTLLGIFVVPVAIAQYPEFFNQNHWVLPVSVVVVILCWVTPLFIHENAKRLAKWIWSRGPVRKTAGIITFAGLIVLILLGGRALLRFHINHLNSALASQTLSQASLQTPPAPEELRVQFKMQWLNMSRRLDVAP